MWHSRRSATVDEGIACHSDQGRHGRHRRPDLQGRRPHRGRQDRRDRQEPEGRQGARRLRLLRHARRHRPAHPSRNALHGHDLRRRFRVRHARGALRRHDDGRRFRAARHQASRCSRRCRPGTRRPARRPRDYSFHMAITWWGEQVWKEMAEVVKRGINTFKHFMAYKGALMVNDDEMYQSFLRCAELGALPLVHAENGDVVARLQQKYMAAGIDRPGGPRLFAPARGRGRGDQPRHHDRRRGRRAALRRPRLLASWRTRRSAGPARSASASMASR